MISNGSNPVSFDGLKIDLVSIPIVATALALTFDVGYFWGTDINLFTIFSTSEHIVFALEALPIALVLASFLTLMPLVIFVLRRIYRFGKPIAQNSDQSNQDDPATYREYLKSLSMSDIILLIAASISLAYTTTRESFTMTGLFIFAISLTVIITLLLPSRTFRRLTIRTATTLLAVVYVFL